MDDLELNKRLLSRLVTIMGIIPDSLGPRARAPRPELKR